MSCCPKCNSEIGSKEKRCSTCGYDISAPIDEPHNKIRLAYTEMADVILAISAVVCLIASGFFTIGLMVNLLHSHYPELLQFAFAALISLALSITFTRTISVK